MPERGPEYFSEFAGRIIKTVGPAILIGGIGAKGMDSQYIREFINAVRVEQTIREAIDLFKLGCCAGPSVIAIVGFYKLARALGIGEKY